MSDFDCTDQGQDQDDKLDIQALTIKFDSLSQTTQNILNALDMLSETDEQKASRVAALSQSHTPDLVDALGMIKARVAALTAKEKILKEQLYLEGAGSYNGSIFRAVVSVFDKKSVDKKALLKKLRTFMKADPFAAFVAKNTKTTPTTQVRVSAQVRA